MACRPATTGRRPIWCSVLEADIQGQHREGQQDWHSHPVTGAAGVFAAYDATPPWFGTVRGRLGYSVGSTLFDATGGLADGSVKTKIATNALGLCRLTTRFLQTPRPGWTAGAGIETPFTLLGLLPSNWTTNTEYLYVDPW